MPCIISKAKATFLALVNCKLVLEVSIRNHGSFLPHDRDSNILEI